ncbi:hypothetical protein, partial [Klebsiella quasipneumoniae]|uniref:hypothetical protein n=1 Tax=Klebsiella quasipneumoniae TaxID=1463165 RepID=UPI001B34BCE0
DLPRLNGVNFRASHFRAYSCMPEKQALRVSGGFSVFCQFPVRNALRPFWRCLQLRDYGKG